MEIRVVPKAFAQPADVHIDRVHIAVALIAPDVVHQLLACEDPARERGHFEQQHKLFLRQNAVPALRADGE